MGQMEVGWMVPVIAMYCGVLPQRGAELQSW
jgi:hypothetical protein